jgi:hypothetical protein
VPNIDAFNLTTGSLGTTLINSSPDTVYVFMGHFALN